MLHKNCCIFLKKFEYLQIIDFFQLAPLLRNFLPAHRHSSFSPLHLQMIFLAIQTVF